MIFNALFLTNFHEYVVMICETLIMNGKYVLTIDIMYGIMSISK